MENNELMQPSVQEIMDERGHFVANGYTFVVEPVYYGEEEAYRNDVPWNLYPRDSETGNAKTGLSDKDLAKYGMFLFKLDSEEKNLKPQGLFGKLKLWLVKHFCRNYKYYSDNPEVVGFIKWIEKKVSYKGKHIKFYDLERKYKLNKAEIVRLFGYFEQMTGF